MGCRIGLPSLDLVLQELRVHDSSASYLQRLEDIEETKIVALDLLGLYLKRSGAVEW
ncbi:hypothetical protein N9Z44_03020 [Mariniblastus sp.]|nr:hypothetical protein [Mariniblastus sp.]